MGRLGMISLHTDGIYYHCSGSNEEASNVALLQQPEKRVAEERLVDALYK